MELMPVGAVESVAQSLPASRACVISALEVWDQRIALVGWTFLVERRKVGG